MMEELGSPGKARRWRWMLPIGVAVLAAGVAVGIVVVVPRDDDGPVAGEGRKSQQDWTMPDFVVTADGWGSSSDSTDWFQIYDLADPREARLVEDIQPPSPTAGEVTSI